MIRLGSHQFSVNVQALDLTTVLRDNEMQLHLSGTRFFETITDDEFVSMRDVWQQEVLSENADIYRGEYLAYQVITSLQDDAAELDRLHHAEFDDLAAFVQRFMGPRYSEGYAKGVHDQDASRILHELIKMYTQVGLLRFHSKSRALGTLFWNHLYRPKSKNVDRGEATGFGEITELFPRH